MSRPVLLTAQFSQEFARPPAGIAPGSSGLSPAESAAEEGPPGAAALPFAAPEEEVALKTGGAQTVPQGQAADLPTGVRSFPRFPKEKCPFPSKLFFGSRWPQRPI